MKKLNLFGIILMCMICAGLTACGSDDKDTDAPYITTADLVGAWKSNLSSEVLTFNSNMTFRRTVVETVNGNSQNVIDESGMYSLSRCNEHYLGFAYSNIVVNNQFDYKPFEWVDASHKSFNLKGTIYSKQ